LGHGRVLQAVHHTGLPSAQLQAGAVVAVRVPRGVGSHARVAGGRAARDRRAV